MSTALSVNFNEYDWHQWLVRYTSSRRNDKWMAKHCFSHLVRLFSRLAVLHKGREDVSINREVSLVRSDFDTVYL